MTLVERGSGTRIPEKHILRSDQIADEIGTQARRAGLVMVYHSARGCWVLAARGGKVARRYGAAW